MPATLGNNLVDDLVPVVDSLRQDLYVSMGNRQYEVHAIKRRWTGLERGDGSPVVVSDVTLSPPPLVKDKVRWQLEAHGRDQQGDGVMTEVSLTYSEADLTGGVLAANEEFFFKVIDLRGQQIGDIYYVPSAPPSTDRDKDIGWVIVLRAVAIDQP